MCLTTFTFLNSMSECRIVTSKAYEVESIRNLRINKISLPQEANFSYYY